MFLLKNPDSYADEEYREDPRNNIDSKYQQSEGKVDFVFCLWDESSQKFESHVTILFYEKKGNNYLVNINKRSGQIGWQTH